MALSASGSSRGGLARVRRQVLLGALLWLGVLAFANLLARDHMGFVRDLSEERLATPSPVAGDLLARLDDRLQVELYFTSAIEHGPLQLAQRQMLDLLGELRRLGGGRIELVRADPARSGEARLEAERLGIQPLDITAQRGTSAVAQRVHLGAVLRYRGRQEVLPLVLPQSLEVLFLGAVQQLLRERPPRIGWFAPEEDPERFRLARELLHRRAEIVPMDGLAEGFAVPSDLDLLVVLAPRELHPRAAFEIDQHVRRGGALLALVDRSQANVAARSLRPVRTGLEALFEVWGLAVDPRVVFDAKHHAVIGLRRGQGGVQRQPYPFFVRVERGGMDETHPGTLGLDSAELFWAHPLMLEASPAGVERAVLLSSSDQTWPVEPSGSLDFSAEAVRSLETELLVRGGAAALPLAVALVGRLPSPHANLPPPPARDPFGGPDRAPRADQRGLAEAAGAARVVLVGDADWAAQMGLAPADEGGLSARPFENRALLENLVDWLLAEPEMAALRARRPKDRRIEDFFAQELEREGVTRLAGALDPAGSAARTLAQERALARAERRRWMWTAGSFALSLLAVAALSGVALRRRRAAPVGGGAP